MSLYVVQVAGGKEASVERLIKRYVQDGLITECFIPRVEVMWRYKGEWTKRELSLIPGYLFIDTPNVGKLAEELRHVPAFTRLLGNDNAFIPLDEDEIAWLNAFTDMGDRVVKMSEGIIEGDKVIILNGPLRNHEAMITKIDRHKRSALIAIPMFGRVKTVRIGLEIVRKRV